VIKIGKIKRLCDCSRYGEEEKYIEGFGGETSMKENTRKTTA